MGRSTLKVLAEGVQYRLRVCSTRWGCEVRVEGVHDRLRKTLCSASLSLYSRSLACTSGVPQSVLRMHTLHWVSLL